MRRKTLAFRFLFLALFLMAAIAATPRLRRESNRARSIYMSGQSEEDIRERQESAFAQILGEVRATSADLMFLKASRYFHVGVGYKAKEQSDIINKEGRAICGAGVPTVIRAAGEDFRGFLGELERQVKPYRDASKDHIHTTQRELLPWYRVMTLANPQFIRGYRMGGMALADENKWREGLEFMEEGIQNNPDSPELFRLYETIASFHSLGHFREKYPWPDQWIENALKPAIKGYELGKRQRPPGGVSEEPYRGMVWNKDVEEDFALNALLIPQLYREKAEVEGDLSQLIEARRWAVEASELLPEYQPLRRLTSALEKDITQWGKKEAKP